MKSFFIVVVLMLRNGGAQTRIGGAPRAKESMNEPSFMMVLCGVAPFAYKRDDGVLVVPVGCLRD